MNAGQPRGGTSQPGEAAGKLERESSLTRSPEGGISSGKRCEGGDTDPVIGYAGDSSTIAAPTVTSTTTLRQRKVQRGAGAETSGAAIGGSLSEEHEPELQGEDATGSMINRGSLAQQGAVGAARWKNSVDPENLSDGGIGGDLYSKTGKPRGHNSLRHRLEMYINTHKVQAAAAALIALGLIVFLLQKGSSAMTEAEKATKRVEDTLWNERRIELQEAMGVAREEVAKIRRRFRAAQENLKKAKNYSKKQEQALDASKRDGQRILNDGKMKMIAQQKKDERIAKATHKSVEQSSLVSDMATKKIIDEQYSINKREQARTKRDLAKSKLEVQAAQAIVSGISHEISMAEDTLQKISDDILEHHKGHGSVGRPDLTLTEMEMADEDDEGGLDKKSEEEQMLEGEDEEPRQEEEDEDEDEDGEKKEDEDDKVEPQLEEPIRDTGQKNDAQKKGNQAPSLEKSILDEDMEGEADEEVGNDDGGAAAAGGGAGEEEGDAADEGKVDEAAEEEGEPLDAEEAIAKADEILQQGAESRAREEEEAQEKEEAVPATEKPTPKPNRRMGARPITKQQQKPQQQQQEQPGGADESPLKHPPQRPSVLQEDDSVRCRTSKICEGPSACSLSADKTLACITDATARRDRVRDAAKWAWQGYKKYAWGQDELHPLSGGYGSWFDLGLTLVDSLDTLILMGLEEEYTEGRDWIANRLNLDSTKTDVNLFETTIRVLGGLLTVYNLTGDQVYLDKATDLGQRLLPAFNTKSGVPLSDVNLKQRSAHGPKWGTDSSTSETTTLYLEFSYLSHLTDDSTYREKASKVLEVVDKADGRIQGLVPIMINPGTGTFRGNTITLGARGDSYYEYLLKCYIISDRTDERCLRMYKESMRGVRERLVDVTSSVGGLLYIAEIKAGMGKEVKSPKMDHLVCFMPGLLALGHYHGVETAAEGEMSDLELAEELARTCYAMYRYTPAGLAPEIVHFTKHNADYPKQHRQDIGDGHFMIKTQDSHNLLRPETAESLYILYKVTGDPVYQDHAWLIFRAFEKHTRVSRGGYASLDSVLSVPAKQRDKMESFWVAETLKYLFLIFEEKDLLPFDSYVLNTEAHPLPIHHVPKPQPGKRSTRSLMQRRRLSNSRPGAVQKGAEGKEEGEGEASGDHDEAAVVEEAGDEEWLSPEEYEEGEWDFTEPEDGREEDMEEELGEGEGEQGKEEVKEEKDAWEAAEEEQAHLYYDASQYDADHDAAYDADYVPYGDEEGYGVLAEE